MRGEFEHLGGEKKRSGLEFMLGKSSSVVALDKKMAKPQTKTVTRLVAFPEAKIVKEELQ